MRIILHQRFIKKYKKLTSAEREKFKERRDLFLEDPFHPLLRNHALHGKYADYRSINITGDMRLVYKNLDAETFLFVEIGTHSELYS